MTFSLATDSGAHDAGVGFAKIGGARRALAILISGGMRRQEHCAQVRGQRANPEERRPRGITWAGIVVINRVDENELALTLSKKLVLRIARRISR